MELRELIKKIRHEKNWTQAQMGTELKINQQDVQGMENAGRNLEKQFSIFLKLFAVCRELAIDPAQDLKGNPSVKEVIQHAGRDGSEISGDATGGKEEVKKKGPRAVSARGNKKNRTA
jgi:transcriptional regulator with XRE-family HTH domain